MKKYYNIPIFVPHEGCKHSCVFCNQRSITGYEGMITSNEVENIIEERLKTMEDDSIREIAFFGGSFTGISTKRQIFYLSIAKRYLDKGLISGIRVSTRPDYIDDETLKILKEFGVSTIELGVQSLDEDVLEKSKRGHGLDEVIKAVNLIKFYNFKLGLQMMIGLPGDDYSKTMYTAEKIISLKPDFTRIYPTVVIKNTELCELYHKAEYVPLEMEEAIEITADVMTYFMRYRVPIIRVGLHPSDSLLTEDNLVAGPFHSSFNHLVMSRIFRTAIESIFSYSGISPESLIVEVSPKDVSNAVGHRRENMEYFKDKFGMELRIVINRDVDRNLIKVGDILYPIY